MPHISLRHAATWLALAALIALSAPNLLWDQFCDSYYWYTHFPFYAQMPMEAATVALGHVWASLMPCDIVLMRLFGWLLLIAAMTAGYLTTVKCDWGGQRGLPYLIAAIVLTGNLCSIHYGPDVTTIAAFTALLCIVFACDVSRPLPAVVLGLVTALAVAVRFPNVLALPLVVAYYAALVSVSGIPLRRVALMAALYSLTAVVSYVALMTVLTGSADVVTTLASEVSGAASGTHSLASLIARYRHDLCDSATRVAWIVGAVALPWALGLVKGRPWWWQTAALLPLAFLLAVNRHTLYGVLYSWNSLLFFLTIVALLFIARSLSPRRLLFYALLLGLALTSAAGSDTGFLKSIIVVWPFLPIVLVDCRRHFGLTPYNAGAAALLMVLALSVWHVRTRERDAATLFRYRDNVTLLSAADADKLSHRLSSVERYGCIGHNLFYGMDGHQVAMLTASPLMYKSSYWQERGDTITETSTIARLFRRDPRAVVFDYTRSPLLRREVTAAGRVTVIKTRTAVIYRHR